MGDYAEARTGIGRICPEAGHERYLIHGGVSLP